ncbi:hypothetical protein [Streptomyces sp. NPDC013455]|uniref:hypothetical protein n=1 Tax=Streptomyces sp. NPDC013455 TaxID=3155605 RepID=UPI00340BA533
MKHQFAGRAAALLCAVMSAVITGCDSDSSEADTSGTTPATAAKHPFDTMTPRQIDDMAREAVRDVTSMRLTGKVISDGRPIAVDLAMDIHGSCNGTVGNSQGTMHLVKKGSRVHVKAGEDFWRATFSREMTSEQAEEMVALFKRHWIKPPIMMSEKLGRICDGLDALIESVDPVSDGQATREADATVDGRPAAVLTERSTTRTTTVYIAKEGKPYLLRGTVSGGDEPMDLTFTDHNKPVDTSSPPPDQILDPTKLR